jgi:hypothetical protein
MNKAKLAEANGYTILASGTILGKRGQALTPFIDKYGYARINILVRRKRYNCLIHRLVALKYIPNPDSKREVNHLDEDKLHNAVSNLEWATSQENKHHGSFRTQMSREVVLTDTGRIFPSAKAAAEYTGGSATNITAACRGHLRTSGGCHWRYR